MKDAVFFSRVYRKINYCRDKYTFLAFINANLVIFPFQIQQFNKVPIEFISERHVAVNYFWKTFDRRCLAGF